ncbi:hypothetical protein SASPL_140657 [Salvia splendens]|uniref:5'-3' DNA helicase ZGRF1-like N-terminal domain-containing protein n=1 Tax=Salvia splendens TaxID=180675 RepID=A0A8X8WSL3_SALSN|nr:hypothetical protein SASPL_140657 [Salvia splendens]
MEEAQRWIVTYTNHVKQKRKVYHDGLLVVQSSRNKGECLLISYYGARFYLMPSLFGSNMKCHHDQFMMYDEWDKLLETRFVKKGDLITSGETITFGSYLADLDRKPLVGKRKGRVINISPSQKMIRAHLGGCGRRQQLRFVLNTSQITQKAKKYHDGFLQLIIRGSQGRQVKLYDTNRRHLDGRFLKKDEKICSGESLILDGHLVDIGEQEEDHTQPTDLNIHISYSFSHNLYCLGYQGKTPGGTSQGKLTKLSDPSYKSENIKLYVGDAEPKRSGKRQPSEGKTVSVNKPFTEECAVSHPSKFLSGTNNHIKEEECSGTARQELRQKGSEHDIVIKVIKSEPTEVEIKTEKSEIPENGRVPPARSSSFHLSLHEEAAAAVNADCQKEVIDLTRTCNNQEEENIFPCEEVVVGSNAALNIGLSFRKSAEKHKKGSSSRFNNDLREASLKTKDMDEIPSFDLGF